MISNLKEWLTDSAINSTLRLIVGIMFMHEEDFNEALDYLRFSTITGISVVIGYLSGIKPGIRGPSMVTGGLIGLMGGFMYAYQNSAGRLMGFFPNEGKVARYHNRGFAN